MSDMTILSNEYSTISSFTKELNDSILTLKKEQKRLHSVGNNSRKEITEAQQNLIRVLKDVNLALSEATLDQEPSEPTDTPNMIIQRLKKSHQGDMAWFRKNLEKALKAIENGDVIDEKSFAVLDEVCGVGDASSSAIFRQMWRK
jgi:hypothetical protein